MKSSYKMFKKQTNTKYFVNGMIIKVTPVTPVTLFRFFTEQPRHQKQQHDISKGANSWIYTYVGGNSCNLENNVGL